MNSFEKLVVSKLRVKIKSLSLETRVIRGEEKKYTGDSSIRGQLRSHRIGVLRSELRSTYLAYAFLRGRRRASLEKVDSKPADEKRVCAIVKSMMLRDYSVQVLAWMNEQTVSAG